MVGFSRRAFTLIELLVSISILAVLIALLMPALHQAMAEAHTIACANNQRQLAVGAISYAVDNENRLPGTAAYRVHTLPSTQKAWVGSTNSTMATRLLENAPTTGTLWEYVLDTSSYRCPELRPGRPGSGLGSNGKFDYSMMTAFSGASFDQLPTQAHVLDERVSAPLFVEEHPRQTINYQTGIEAAHDTKDRLGNWHPGDRGNYVAVDGSMHAIYTPQGDSVFAWDWFARPPKQSFTAEQMPNVYGESHNKGMTSLGYNLDLGQTGNGWGDWDYR